MAVAIETAPSAIEELVQQIRRYDPDADVEAVCRAYEYAEAAHTGQSRDSGAPYIERGRGNLDLHTALSAITAAVVGVVLNLAVWFAWNVVRPASGGTDYFAAAAALVFFFLLQRKKLDVLPLIALAAVTGWAWKLLTGL